MQRNESDLELWLEPQLLCQKGEMDCGVEVFRQLTGLSREEILSDVPESFYGITLDRWEEYLESKGWKVTRYQPREQYPLPCAHFHKMGPNFGHWIYQAENGGIHDPGLKCGSPPRLLKLSTYNIVLTLTVRRCDLE